MASVNKDINWQAYYQTVWEYKAVIIGTTLFSILTAIMLSFYVIQPVYEADVTFLIEKVDAQIKSVDAQNWAPGTYVELIKSRHLVSSLLQRVGSKKSPEEILAWGKADIIPGTDLLQLIVKGNSPSEVKDLANQWADAFIEEIRSLRIESIQQLVRQQKLVVEELEKSNDALKSKTIRHSGAGENGGTLEQVVIQSMSFVLSQKLSEEQIRLSRLNEMLVMAKEEKELGVKIISRAELPKEPVSPQKRKNVVVATIFGVMIGIILAFSMDYFEQYKKQSSASKTV